MYSKLCVSRFVKKSKAPELSRRERQLLEIIYRRGASSAGEVQDALDDKPNYSAVRGVLSTLEKKGHLRIERIGTRYVYHPIVPREAARINALTHVIETFFDGSLSLAVSTIIDQRKKPLTKREREELETLLEKAGREGR